MTKTATAAIVDEDTETDSESEEEGDTAGDDTFYGSYTPEADIKDVEEELADE